MLGAVFPGDRTVQLMNFPDPEPGPSEVVLEIKASGMCGSDLKRYRGAPLAAALARGPRLDTPIIAGHEPCGVVVATGTGVSPRIATIGDRMMVHHYKGCGCCSHCFSGWTQNCAELSASYGNNAHGGHASYMKVPASTLVRLPSRLSFEVGAAISCGGGTAWGALKRGEFSPRDTLLVVGQGPVGQSVTQFASDMGGEVIAMDISDERLEKSRSFGATHIINPRSVDTLEAVRALTSGIGAQLVIDTSGTASGALDAVRCAATWGRVVLVGMGGTVQLDISEHIIRKQLSIKGSWTFSLAWQSECADYVARRALPVETLFTHRWRLDQADEAYRLFDSQLTGKAVFLT